MSAEPPNRAPSEISVDAGRDSTESPSVEQFRRLYQLIGGYRVSQAMYVMARLGIADLLAGGARTTVDLAEVTGTHPDTLQRLLRFLAGIDLVRAEPPSHFALTPLGIGLRSDVPGSVRPNVLMLLAWDAWQSWGDLLFSVRTGNTAFDHVHSMGRFAYLQQNSEAAAIFNAAMTSNTALSGVAITQRHDFSGIHHLVDVGGGHGLLLATVLQSHPAMEGTLFDRPDVVVGAATVLESAGVANRCQIVGRDFFESVPAGGDAYLLRQIIHDWDDDRATQILRTCRRALSDRGKLLVVERRVDCDYRQALAALHIDLEMLVNVGGRERTDDEYAALFAGAGFHLTTIIPLNDTVGFAVFEGIPI